MNSPALTLYLLAEKYAVCRLDAGHPIPAWALEGEFVSITRTPEELSIVTRQQRVPEGVRHEPDWRCLKVAGPLEFTLPGILASLFTPLAEAGIPVFALSTFDTDYLLVREGDLVNTIAVLARAGHRVQ